mmetsp:Transcript_41899/g.98226  ORF Transcript_41899/g.98226 Transcript_41899/m.98226 type:complete len:673 (+) Transcript_41899:43-2061(+)
MKPDRAAVVGVTAGAAAAVVAGLCWHAWRRNKSAEAKHRKVRIRLLFGSTTGTAQKWADHAATALKTLNDGNHGSRLEVVVEDLQTFQFDSLLTPLSSQQAVQDVVLIFLSTHTEGLPPPSCAHFCTLLRDHRYDFRVGTAALSHLVFGVVGFGSIEYEPAGHYCTAASGVDADLAGLSATRLLPCLRVTDTEDVAAQVSPWLRDLTTACKKLLAGEAAPLLGAAAAGGAEDDVSDAESDETSTTRSSQNGDNNNAGDDLEDLTESCASSLPGATQTREMVTKRHREQLTKEGYKIVGSHSAVKLCRWTKHQLRGRGGCYKHSFYGITSFQCMEATPSLACANKCVFCWRHHKNPVGTSWKWKMDPPEMIVEEGIEQHRRMIRECKGIPGVKPERFEAALQVRHCALSLVGEPIMYPRINELVGDLHRRKISTFLVTNAQFPDAIQNLDPVTQLYVSVDAPNREALKAVDRPLFADFWERYVDSLKALREKKQRTTYRLTLVKDHNMSDAAEYARLVALGEPDFIEIKSVTFCGESKASSLNISNVPWHEEIRQFSEAMLAAEGLSSSYELACEHQHSCIVLIAHKRYKKEDGSWLTWINYDRFHELVASGKEFTALDYAEETPAWAIYGSEEAGFDPKETRVYHNRTKRKAKAGLLSEAQLRHYPSDPAAA